MGVSAKKKAEHEHKLEEELSRREERVEREEQLKRRETSLRETEVRAPAGHQAGGQQQGVKRSPTSPPATAPLTACKKRLADNSLQESGESELGQVMSVTLSQQTRKDFGLSVDGEQSEDEDTRSSP